MAQKTRGIVGEIEKRRTSFALAFLGLFLATIAFMSAADALPEPILATPNQTGGTTVVVPEGVKEYPMRIVAKSINLEATVANPSSTNATELDKELLRGAVRYPTSAQLGEDGTVVLFGHSSYLPVVHNQAYKTFDGIQTLKTGEMVSVFSPTMEYRYKVTGVRTADATEDVIPLEKNGKHLTLVTCDSFSTKTSRFVVTLELAGTYAIETR